MKLNRKVELLAPAKDKETAIAAINSGADAVYIGANKFGARQNASNNLEDIKDIVDYAHLFKVRVHVTLNTILTDEELENSIELINKLYKIGVDAIIVQDMGIFDYAIKKKLPPIEIHASTQCNNRTLEKVLFFQKMGVKRVILARELSLENIEKICKTVKNSDFNSEMEIETFVHGALCVSYSGQCYLSESIGNRSANRGECAQPCRKKYTLIDEDGKVYAKDKHLLSLKDFNGSKHLERLINAGVKSFKIEGRLKDINYVKNVIAYYRREIDKFANKTSSGEIFLDFEPDVNKSFNRGFTDYFLTSTGLNTQNPRKDRTKNIYNFDTPKSLGEKIGKVEKIGKDFFTLKGETLNPQDGLCYFAEDELTGCLVNKVEGNKIYPNNMGKIQIGTFIYRNFNNKFEKELNNSKTKRRIGVDFVLENNILIAKDEDNNIAKIEIGELEEAKNLEKMVENFNTQLSKTGESNFYTKSIEIKGEIGFMPISVINELRRNILEKLEQERLKNYPKLIQGELNYTEFPFKTYDYHANVTNRTAKEFYKNCGCEITEYAPEKTKNFKDKELMRTKHCLKFAFDLCKNPKKLYLIDEKGKKYSLDFDCKNCEMLIKE
ncbi:U32 family peptidase [bacterium]|nr:U32 family peptidase [bacterium]